jgi:hypothetical protein
MDENLAIVARAAQEVEPAARELAQAVGRSRVGEQIIGWVSDIVRVHRASHVAAITMRAAEKIHESGIPPVGVEDRLVRAVLEHGAFEDDGGMQERWSSLLASAATGTPVPPAFPEILRQLEPIEARLLDAVPTGGPNDPWQDAYLLSAFPEHIAIEWRHLDNLERLGVVQFDSGLVGNQPFPESPPIYRVRVYRNPLGHALIHACRSPRAPE